MSSGMDLHDVKSEIKRMKGKKSQLDVDKRYLEEEIEKASAKMVGLKKELSVLKPMDEVRLFQDEGVNEGVGNTLFNVDGSITTGSKQAKDIRNFQLMCNTMNAKLELQILNEEIRACLPKLEKEANMWEAQSQSTKKSASKSSKSHDKCESSLIKSAEETEQLIGEQLDIRFQLKAQIAKEVEMKKHLKNQITQEVATLRRSISKLLDTKDSITSSHGTYEAELMCEEARLKLLAQEHHQLRTELSRKEYHGGLFWQTDAFMSIAGARNAKTVEVAKVPSVLCRWLRPEMNENDNDTINLDIVLEKLSKLASGDADQEGVEEGGQAAEDIDVNSKIDFNLFLQLCDLFDPNLEDD